MKLSTFAYYLGLAASIGIILICFMPWVRFTKIDLVFTGFNVTPFAGGDYYGRAGIPITVLASVILLFILLPRLWAKRFNLFLSALLFAYCIRTYIVFTSSLFEGEVVKYAGIYLIILFSAIMLVCSAFPSRSLMPKTDENP